MKKLILIALLINACGKSNSLTTPVPGVTKPSQQSFLVAVVTGSGYTASQPVSIILPSPSDFQVISNASQSYHVSFSLGNVTCDYIHNVNSSTLVNGGGCSTLNTEVNLAIGESASITAPATVQVTLNGRTL